MQQNEFAVKFQSDDLYNIYAITSGAYPQGTIFSVGQTIYVTPFVYTASTLSLSNYASWQGLHLIPFQGIWNNTMADRDIYKIVIADTSMVEALNIAMNARTIMAAPTKTILENVWGNIVLQAQGSTQDTGIRYKSEYPVVFVSEPPANNSPIKTYMNMAAPFGHVYNPLEINSSSPWATTWAELGSWQPSMMSTNNIGTACLSSDVLNWLSSGTYQIQGVTMSEGTKSALPIMPQFYSASEAVKILNHRTDYNQPLYMVTTLSPNSSDWYFPNFLNNTVFWSSTSLTSSTSGFDIVNLAPAYLDQKAASQIAPSFASGAFVLSKLPYVIGNTFWTMQDLQQDVSYYALPANQLGIANTVSSWTDFINGVSSDLQNDIYQYWTSTTTMPTGPAPTKTTKTASAKSKSQTAN